MSTIESDSLIGALQNKMHMQHLESLQRSAKREAERFLFWESVYKRQKELQILSIVQSLKDSMYDNNYARFNH